MGDMTRTLPKGNGRGRPAPARGEKEEGQTRRPAPMEQALDFLQDRPAFFPDSHLPPWHFLPDSHFPPWHFLPDSHLPPWHFLPDWQQLFFWGALGPSWAKVGGRAKAKRARAPAAMRKRFMFFSPVECWVHFRRRESKARARRKTPAFRRARRSLLRKKCGGRARCAHRQERRGNQSGSIYGCQGWEAWAGRFNPGSVE